jgi:hypothetical protein
MQNNINLNLYYCNNNNINNIKNNINPTLAYQRNTHKFYKNQITKTNKIMNSKFHTYSPQYFNTTYDRILFPAQENVPY